jgi:RNA polymerase sigma-70 factor (ECF subfamily)
VRQEFSTMTADPHAGQQQRFEEWVREHGKAVRGFLLALVRRGDVADDLCQEVFCRAWEGRERYAEQGKTRAYLLQIANRLVVDRGRRNEPRSNLDDDAWRACEPSSHAPGPSQSAERNEQVRLLHSALDRLAPMQQRVLLLRFFGQMDFQEIADTLQTPLNTALSHCRRGLESLRKLLVETEA